MLNSLRPKAVNICRALLIDFVICVRLKSKEDELYELPEHLQVESQKRSEEMLSNQMLSGIPEVDLGIE